MKYFIISDTHSFFKSVKEALDEAGYDKNNKEHTLVVLGDLFDRGDETVDLFNFITSIPESNRTLIKGNHEYILEDLLNKDFPSVSDFTNGTVHTVCSMVDTPTAKKFDKLDIYDFYLQSTGDMAMWKTIRKSKKLKPYIDFLKSNEWKHYLELGPYILTHSFIPVKLSIKSIYGLDLDGYKEHASYNKYWRKTSTDEEWLNSTWGCPYLEYQAGLFSDEEDEGKKLICGHWITDDFYKYLDYGASHEQGQLYFNRDKGIIGIDGGVWRYTNIQGTHLYKRVNVLVIDEDMKLYYRGEELK